MVVVRETLLVRSEERFTAPGLSSKQCRVPGLQRIRISSATWLFTKAHFCLTSNKRKALGSGLRGKNRQSCRAPKNPSPIPLGTVKALLYSEGEEEHLLSDVTRLR